MQQVHCKCLGVMHLIPRVPPITIKDVEHLAYSKLGAKSRKKRKHIRFYHRDRLQHQIWPLIHRFGLSSLAPGGQYFLCSTCGSTLGLWAGLLRKTSCGCDTCAIGDELL